MTCRIGLWIALAILPPLASSASTVHLLGFVERLCPQEPYCFELRVEPEYTALVGDLIRVRFADASGIFDPENYELTLAQQNIAAGSHLRLLVHADEAAPGDYRADFIWIGD